jgi:hypothetical protein
MFLLLSFMFSPLQNRRTGGGTGWVWHLWEGEVAGKGWEDEHGANNIYTYM